MTTLLLRLAGPMQSWGTQSNFTDRDTGREPSKSGVIGLLCAALGRARTSSIEDLRALRLGMRVEREGRLEVDYHTTGGTNRVGDRNRLGDPYGVAAPDGKVGGTVLSRRYYLADADFLVGLEGDENLLRELNDRLARPVWHLYLGRKAFLPGVPVRLPDRPPVGPGLLSSPLEIALRQHPWLGGWPGRAAESPPRCRLILERPTPQFETRRDNPVSFEPREFTLRYVSAEWVTPPKLEVE